MKRTAQFVVTLLLLAIAGVACNDQKTIQEYLREEKRDMDRFINKTDIQVIKEEAFFKSLKDGTLEENQYFKTNEGLYIHVVDSGNGKKITPLGKVCVRFETRYVVKDFVSGTDTLGINYTDLFSPGGILPMEFSYGNPGTYANLVCNGWALPLQYVGEDGIVDLLIPSSLGAASDNNYFRPTFYKGVHYTKFW